MAPSAPTNARGQADPGGPAATLLDAAVARLAQGGFIAYPTETVRGLGACADWPRAIERLFAWKGRAETQPLAVRVRSVAAAVDLGAAARCVAGGGAAGGELLEEPLLVDASGYDAGGGAPSTVVDCTKPVPEILREGALPRAVIEPVWSR